MYTNTHTDKHEFIKPKFNIFPLFHSFAAYTDFCPQVTDKIPELKSTDIENLLFQILWICPDMPD